MAFLYLDCVPDCLDVESDPDGYIVAILAVQDGSQLVTLDVRLDPMSDQGPDIFELSYCFTIDDADGGGLAYSTQDRFEVDRHFCGLSKAHVLPSVCAAVEALVCHVQPSSIYRVTKGIKLPQKALVKYLLVTEHLSEMGFQVVDEGTDGFGRLFWLMSR
jgi:hypothetical protein